MVVVVLVLYMQATLTLVLGVRKKLTEYCYRIIMYNIVYYSYLAQAVAVHCKSASV